MTTENTKDTKAKKDTKNRRSKRGPGAGRGRGGRWKRAARRFAALFFATLALWLLGLTCDPGAACAKLGESAAFVSTALRLELGEDAPAGAWEGLGRWDRLALGQSSLLFPIGAEEDDTAPDAPPAGEGDAGAASEDDAERPLPDTVTAPEDIQERTLLPADTEGYLAAQGVSLFNYTNKAVDVAALAAAQVTIHLEDSGPQVLIMHTHTTEAYTMDGTDVYAESDASRTIDEHYNMLRVGDEMQQIFEGMGLRVVHDRTLYDYPQYSGAYTRSCAGVESWLERYPTIQVVLDVHRDALIGSDGTVYKAVTDVDGEKTAQVLMIVGTDDLGQEHPYWPENLALSIRIQQHLDARWPTLARPITLRSSRFNQQLTRGSLLIEVGSHGNTLQEALRGARLFAQAAGEVLLELVQDPA